MSDQPPLNPSQEAGKLKEVEEQLRENRVRCEELTKRLSESTEQLARAKESEAQLETERKRANDLHAKLVKVETSIQGALNGIGTEGGTGCGQHLQTGSRELAKSFRSNGRPSESLCTLNGQRQSKVEQQISRIPDLESALKVEQDAIDVFRQEAANWQKASGRIADLESTLYAERSAAEQLVQQLADLEQVAIRARDLEARLASAEQQGAELHLKIQDLEAELLTERRKGEETTGQLHELERVAIRVQEMEGLLTAERDHNGMLARQVVEAEQAAENATKRLEEMARKLSEIAGLASQLGHGKG